jgi:hypothetical protein
MGVVLVTSYFRYLASAPKVHWQAGAAAPALEQKPKLRVESCLLAFGVRSYAPQLGIKG